MGKVIKIPYSKRKLPNKNRYRVYNTATGRIIAKSTTKRKAEAQLRLLRTLKG